MSNDRIDDLSSSRDVVVQFIDVIWKIRYAVAHSKDLKKYCLAGSSEGSSASGLFLRSLPSNRVRMEKKFALQLADRVSGDKRSVYYHYPHLKSSNFILS